MADETNIAKIKLSSDDGRSVEAQLQFSNSSLSIADELILPIISKAGFKNVASCSITLGAYNIALTIQNYTLTDTIYIDNFYNMPSFISILQVSDINIHIVKQRIELLQADCQSVLLADCQINQLDLGLAKHSAALREKSEKADDMMSTAYSMKSVDIRDCEIKKLQAYIACDNINIQESTIDVFNLVGGFGSKVTTEIKRLNIWLHTTIKSSEIYCTITEFKLSDSTISNLIAKAYCKINKLDIKDSTITDAHCFEKKHFQDDGMNSNTWLLIGKPATNRLDVTSKTEAYYHISKEIHKNEKGIKGVCSRLFGACSGYGYKPYKALLTCAVIVLLASGVLLVNDLVVMGCGAFSNYFHNLIIAIIATVGQSGLDLSCGFAFWVATIENITAIILFAVFVNALYVKYKD